MNVNIHPRKGKEDVDVVVYDSVDSNGVEYAAVNINTSDGDVCLFLNYDQYRNLIKQLKRCLKKSK